MGGGQDGILTAAHDACQCYGLLVICDHEIVGAQGKILAVEQGECLTLGGAADADAVLDHVGIKGVSGLTDRHHDVVGHVHKGVDGAQADLPEAGADEEGSGLDRKALHLHADVAGTALCVLNAHVKCGDARGCLVGLDGEKLGVVESRDLASHAVVAPQIGAVGHGLVVDLENDVVKTQGNGDVLARLDVEFGKIDDLMLLGRGEEVSKTHLVSTADHAVAGNTAQLGGLDLHGLALAVPAHPCTGDGDDNLHADLQVRATANDIVGGFVTRIYQTNAELVGVGMRVDREDLAHNDVVEGLGNVVYALHLDGGHGQLVGQSGELHVVGQLDVILDPIQGKLHARILLFD